jgi:regulator of protease activity HflC (stomatin/prohibitin superfamily)
MQEKKAWRVSAYLVLAIGLVLAVGLLLAAVRVGGGGPWRELLAVAGGVAALLSVVGLVIVNPNQAVVVQLFGTYVGSIREPGFWWVFPLMARQTVSLRVRNFETSVLKVNDLDGNPVEIAAVVVWQVRDSAQAVFQVNAYEEFVLSQAETAIRHVATSYPYDSHADGPSLRTGAVVDELSAEIQRRIERAGVTVLESRITHLAYAPEIAHAMLQRQQANAVVAARARIVEGAVGMVEMALDRLNERHIVDLDEERKAAMVSNLLVVLCSESSTQPIINTGTLYQ